MADGEEWWVVDDTLALILRVSRFYGVAPVRFNSRNGRVAYLSRIHYYIGILVAFILDLIFIYKFCVYYIFKNTERAHVSFNKETILHITSKIADFPIKIFVIYNFTRMKKLLCLVIRIRDIKKTINSDFYQHTKRWWFTCLTLLLTLGLWIPMVLSVCLIPEWKLFQSFYLVYTSNLWLFIELQFVILARYITSTFADLNERLEDVLLQLNVQHNNIHRTALARKVRYLSRTFVSICTAMLELNSIESVNLFFHLCHLSLNFGFLLNSFLTGLAHIDWSNENLHQIVNQSMYLFFNLIRTLLIVESCHGTRKQISRTRLLTGKIMNHVTSRTDQLLEAADTLFKQVLLNDISYIAMGICALDRHVICTIFGVITTVLSISTN